MPSVFLSHSSKDKFFVREFAARLKVSGVEVWIDEAELKVGDSLSEKIGAAITKSDYIAFFLSNNSINSKWVQEELGAALQKDITSNRRTIIPILLEKIDLPPFLQDKVYANFANENNFENEFNRVLTALGVNNKALPVAKEVKVVRSGGHISHSVDSLESFQNLSIVEFDTNRSHRVDERSLLERLYLRLSGPPPIEWTQIFDAERKFPRHSMWRRAWVEGNYVVIQCVPEELEKYHLNDLKQDVDNANSKYRAYMLELQQVEARKKQGEEVQQQNLENIKRRLGL